MTDMERDWKQQLIRGVREALEAAYLISADWERAVDHVVGQVYGESLFMQIEQQIEVAEIERLGRESLMPEDQARRLFAKMQETLVRVAGEAGVPSALRDVVSNPGWLDKIMAERAERIERGEPT